MAETTGALVKAFVESLGLGLAAYPDMPPRQTKRPYVVVQDEIALVGDPWQDGRSMTGVETVQVDLHQDWRDLDGRLTGHQGRLVVDYSLGRRLRQGLDGCRLVAAGGDANGQVAGAVVYAVVVAAAHRTVDEKDNVHTNTLTLEVHRAL